MGFGIWFQVWFFFFFSLEKEKEKEKRISHFGFSSQNRHNPSSVWFVITSWIGTGG
jgi:hypothetical protein